MHIRLASATLALLLAAAGEIPANRFALDAAELSMTDCEVSRDAEQARLCRHEQQGFQMDYLIAMSGGGCEAREVAQSLFLPSYGGLKRNGGLACSWAILAQMMWKTGECIGDIQNAATHYCEGRDETELSSSASYATALYRIIKVAPSRPPVNLDGEPLPEEHCDVFSPDLAAKGVFGPPSCGPNGTPLRPAGR